MAGFFLTVFLTYSAGRVYILAPLVLTSPAIAQQTLTHINTGFSFTPAPPVDGVVKAPDAKWTRPTEAERDRGILVMVEVQGTPKQVTWHRKGDYFATVAVEGGCEWTPCAAVG